MKSPTPKAQCLGGIVKIQPPTCDVNFSNNISIPQVRVNKRETELDSIFKILGFIFKCVSHTMTGEDFQIYSVQVTRKCICKTFPLPYHDLIISPHVKQPPKFYPKNFILSYKAFFKKKVPINFFCRDTML